MILPTVVNMHRIQFDPTVDQYIGRAGKGLGGYFGNPFTLGEREENIQNFRTYAQLRVAEDPEYRQAVKGLAGKRLVCFCAPQPCHGDVLVELCQELWEEDAAQDYLNYLDIKYEDALDRWYASKGY